MIDHKNIVISPVEVENALIHIIEYREKNINVAIELTRVVLLGCSINSANSEFRDFNINKVASFSIIDGKSQNKKLVDIYKKCMEKIQIITDLKPITKKSISFLFFYWLCLHANNKDEKDFIDLNAIIDLQPLLANMNKILLEDQIISMNEIKEFATYILTIDGTRIGSKIVTISKEEILNSNDITYEVWKTLYVNKIIRNIYTAPQFKPFPVFIDWGLIYAINKQMYTNESLIKQVVLGENLKFVRTNTIRQIEKIKQENGTRIMDLKDILNTLKTTIDQMDYQLNDLSVVLFHEYSGESFYGQISSMITTGEVNLSTTIMRSHENYKNFVLQLMYAFLSLTRCGIMHNDPHLNNILISKSIPDKSSVELQLSPNKSILVKSPEFNVTIIDFGKSILSYKHHNTYDDTRFRIESTVSVLFEDLKSKIVDDYYQTFTCFVFYDIIRFGFSMIALFKEIEELELQKNRKYFDEGAFEQNLKFTENVINTAVEGLKYIYEPDVSKLPFNIMMNQSGYTWLIEKIYEKDIRQRKTKSSTTDMVTTFKLYSSMTDNTPVDFISAKKKFAEMLKNSYIAKYAMNER